MSALPLDVAVVYGAPTPPGRLALASTAAAAALRTHGCTTATVDLHALLPHLLSTAGEGPVAEAISTIESAGAVVIASPVYRASWPGALKCLVDLLPVSALRDKPVGLIAMGGSPHHYLAVDRHLRDVLAWFGALAAPTSVYLTGKSFVDGTLAPEALEEIGALAATVIALSSLGALGPDPLAASAW